ncbi:hypothetical protein IFR04_008772 [Cadophora malorum]|uniref:Uncharacterized protein n=1 Tax=Cadophora malorum TaxID=108018 RepID=A0A8H7TEQ9_9HELO|nr:hypothetical protein IFR04_008772 [Cadophora malorum]
MTSFVEICVLVTAFIGTVYTLGHIFTWVALNTSIGKRIRPPAPTPGQPSANLADWQRLMEARLRTMKQILQEDRRQRANPPEMEVVAQIRPRYRTRANSAAAGPREPTQ